jgi:hypothetical protein
MRYCAVLSLLLVAGCNDPSMTMDPGGGGGGGGTGDPGQPGSGQALRFAVVGDSRPGNENDTANYPTAIVSGNFKLIQAKSLQFVVATGDYMFASTAASVTAQVDDLLMSESAFSGPVYRAMGNHECTGATASNCPAYNETANVTAFMTRLLPSGVTAPYFRQDFDTPNGKAKFVFIAANAWNQTQASWLDAQLSDPTPYTFVVRHEPADVTETPGVSPSEAIIAKYPYTIELLGHSHEYRRLDTQHVISGNGGAPVHSYYGGAGSGYGFLMFEQQADGSLQATEIDEMTGNPMDAWKISAAGKAL